MIDPFFFGRLMHAFTAMDVMPDNRAIRQRGTIPGEPKSRDGASTCRVIREAEEVAIATLRQMPTTPEVAIHQSDRHSPD